MRKNSGSRWTLDNNITTCPDGSIQSETRCPRENQFADWGLCGPQWSTVDQPSQDEEDVLLWPREKVWVNIAVRPCLHSFLSHNKHHPFENKVWEIYIFIKKSIRSLLKSFVISWLCSHVYLYMYTCSCIMSIQQYQTKNYNCVKKSD